MQKQICESRHLLVEQVNSTYIQSWLCLQCLHSNHFYQAERLGDTLVTIRMTLFDWLVTKEKNSFMISVSPVMRVCGKHLMS